ncbi:MAG: hypothetical protein JNL96_19265 [Planctomycetaceae bacterium]|nr:hypothetical protein [Planctomycetaceae bacterium]
MARVQLRVYRGPEAAEQAAVDSGEHTVNVPFGDIYPLLADAVNNRRTWLRDFEHEEITIPTDLYEVLLAYQFSRRPSA